MSEKQAPPIDDVEDLHQALRSVVYQGLKIVAFAHLLDGLTEARMPLSESILSELEGQKVRLAELGRLMKTAISFAYSYQRKKVSVR